MGHLSRLRVVVLHNRDFDPSAPDPENSPQLVARADVENAARDVAGALRSRGHEVLELAVPPSDPIRAALESVEEARRFAPDLVFNLCESLAGDARHEMVLPALLEL